MESEISFFPDIMGFQFGDAVRLSFAGFDSCLGPLLTVKGEGEEQKLIMRNLVLSKCRNLAADKARYYEQLWEVDFNWQQRCLKLCQSLPTLHDFLFFIPLAHSSPGAKIDVMCVKLRGLDICLRFWKYKLEQNQLGAILRKINQNLLCWPFGFYTVLRAVLLSYSFRQI